jgi:acetyl-CoA carboxylase, biotin carboxylase subunit
VLAKVLIANRGEIAVRLVRALRELGICSVAVYSEADRSALHVRMADEAVAVGAAPAAESYLNIAKLIAAAKSVGADAIHPGYGFLSENADFAAACEHAGIVFVGPSADSIRRLGSKIEARKIAIEAGVPVVPGTTAPAAHPAAAATAAREIGYPILLKAAAGGGGKGMRLIQNEAELEAGFRAASSEAENAFGSREVYLEKAIVRPRHVEIQVLGDLHGHMIHLGERECSIQRRHQKVIEECPSPLVAFHPALRESMGKAAVAVARHAGYANAGTVEFLVDERLNFYFLEMNTRLQVEHPVTELVTRLDLVHWQLHIAAGEPLALTQDKIQWSGSAIECRIYAEDPANQFLPSPGRIVQLDEPSGPGVRFDSGVFAGWTVPMEYDPMLAKLAVWGETRAVAIQRLTRALTECHVAGITTNIAFFRNILADAEFRAGRLHTGFLTDYFARRDEGSQEQGDAFAVAALVAALHDQQHKRSHQNGGSPGVSPRWLTEGRDRLLR